MKKRLEFFSHVQPNPSVKGIWSDLFLNLFVVLVPLVFLAPVSGALVCGFLCLVSLTFHWLKWRIYSPLTYITAIAVMVTLRTTLPHGAFSGEFFALLFATMAILKSCNLRTYEDGVIFLILVLATNASLFLLDSDSSILILLWAFGTMLWTLANLLRLNLKNFSSPALVASLKSAAYATFYTLPLLVFLFYIFQKFSHAGFYYYDRNDAVVGLGQSLEPGKISRLSETNNIAFRAKFSEDIPMLDLYWRGNVLSHSKGLVWKALHNVKELENRPHSGAVVGDRCVIEQIIYAQKTAITRVALDVPFPETFSGNTPYRVSSFVCGNAKKPGRFENDLPSYYLKVDAPVSFAVASLVGEIKNKSKDTDAFLFNLQKYFTEQKFIYTLTPKALTTKNTLDEFLFKTRQGFCEHFAAAFATLARIGGVPARVITGYQGGLYNSYGGFWTVNYRDAHAWVEVWKKNRGWVRIDPIAVVAPERIRVGMNAFEGRKDFMAAHLHIDNFWMLTDAFFFWVRGIFDHRETLMSVDELTFNPFHIGALAFVLLCWIQVRRLTQDYNFAINTQFKKLNRLLNEKTIVRARWEGYESYRKRLLDWLDREEILRPLGPTVDRVFRRFIIFKYSATGLPPQDLHNLYDEIKTLSRAIRLKTNVLVTGFKRKTSRAS